MGSTSGQKPAEGYSPRKVTDKRGGHIEPEGAQPRFTGSKRGTYPKGNEPTWEGKATRPTGNAQEHDLVSKQVPPVITRPSGDSKTMTNPLKG